MSPEQGMGLGLAESHCGACSLQGVRWALDSCQEECWSP